MSSEESNIVTSVLQSENAKDMLTTTISAVHIEEFDGDHFAVRWETIYRSIILLYQLKAKNLLFLEDIQTSDLFTQL